MMRKALSSFMVVALLLWVGNAAWADGGQDCANAVSVGTGVHHVAGPTSGDGVSHCANGTNAEWFEFTAPTTGIIQVTTAAPA